MTQIAELEESAAPKPREPLIREITLKNFLSFGPDTEPLELRPLNVLIGPNGSGKSNLIEAISVIRSTPDDLRKAIPRGARVTDWIWRGRSNSIASIEVEASITIDGKVRTRHSIELQSYLEDLRVSSERIEWLPNASARSQINDGFVSNSDGIRIKKGSGGEWVTVPTSAFDLSNSALAQFKDPLDYFGMMLISNCYRSCSIYREWCFGRRTVFREPQPADGRNDRLEEDFSNLGMFLNQLGRQPAAKRQLLRYLRDLYGGLEDYEVIVHGGTVQVFITESEFTIPATRLSDGTLRFLCLLAILCDPNPPRLICIEEPELGLHPDIIPKLAELLVEASQRTQLIVTTHSEILVDSLTEYPESIVVCEKHNGQTQMRRLNADDLSEWLEKYRLGDLWSSGQIGGNRW